MFGYMEHLTNVCSQHGSYNPSLTEHGLLYIFSFTVNSVNNDIKIQLTRSRNLFLRKTRDM